MKASNIWLGLLGAAVTTFPTGADTTGYLTTCYDYGIGNGECDPRNNKEECDFDGGDCCECTCDPSLGTSDDLCKSDSFYACIDPLAPCVDEDDDITADMFHEYQRWHQFGDGLCDQENNVPEYGYDDGDCCECTCETDNEHLCQFFVCLDPEAECAEDDVTNTDDAMSYEFMLWETED
ncbi:unnamed protein product [Ectocarpus sp. 8 AP-2014]